MHEAPAPNAEAPDATAPGDNRGEPEFKWSRRHSRHRDHTNDRVVIGGNATLEQGQRADNVVSVMGSSTSAGESQDVVSVLGDTHVTGSANDDTLIGGAGADTLTGGGSSSRKPSLPSRRRLRW